MSDEARKRVLERRARFVAAALSSVAIGCERPPPPCLSPVHDERAKGLDAGPEDTTALDAGPSATPCLSVVAPEEDAAVDTKPAPHPCLKIPPPKKDAGPKVCLEYVD